MERTANRTHDERLRGQLRLGVGKLRGTLPPSKRVLLDKGGATVVSHKGTRKPPVPPKSRGRNRRDQLPMMAKWTPCNRFGDCPHCEEEFAADNGRTRRVETSDAGTITVVTCPGCGEEFLRIY